MTDPLFEPIKINRLQIKNRICMPAMHMGMAHEFQVTDPLLAFYRERSLGGAGLITVGYATVDELSGNSQNIGAHRDDFIPGLRRLAKAIQEGGARAAVQLNHAGRYNFSFFTGGETPVAPSALASRLTRETPRALETEEIPQIVARFAQAAARVGSAGFDAVEILCGTGYLISEFLSPLTNQRQDAYGGSLDNRLRFPLEVLQAVRHAVGPAFPILVRMNGNDFMNGGQGRQELQAVADRLVAGGGADALSINVGWHEARVPQIIAAVPHGVFSYLARGIRNLVSVPVIAGHRINDPHLARELISQGSCDMVAMGRSLIADPRLPEKARDGREKEILHCVACAQGCFDNLFKLKPVECLCNPRAGHESACKPAVAEKVRRVMVVGGGPAGMSAALAAAEAGHQVTLFEEDSRLGGQLHLAGAPPGRADFAGLATDLAAQLACSAVRVVLRQPVDLELVVAEKPDAVILATGARPLTPPIPGVESAHVVQAWDLLAGRTRAGQRVAIVGGGAVGVETALFLAEQGTLSGEALKFLFVNRAEDPETLFDLATRGTRQVTLVELLDQMGKEIGRSTRWAMLQDLARAGIVTLGATRALAITPAGLSVETAGGIREIPADTVVLAAGSRSFNPLQAALAARGIPCRVTGDANRVGLAFDAVHDGFAAGREVG